MAAHTVQAEPPPLYSGGPLLLHYGGKTLLAYLIAEPRRSDPASSRTRGTTPWYPHSIPTFTAGAFCGGG